MSIFNKVITKVFGKKSDKDLKKLFPIVEQINEEYNKLSILSDQELKEKFNQIKSGLHNSINDEKNNLANQNIKPDEIDIKILPEYTGCAN